ncbi:MAG: cytochrome c oxidase assembly protein [candidate division NC10 bacterium]|nr:cytochrome c oxidase assembly protein [candidate division NC10 bacterium]
MDATPRALLTAWGWRPDVLLVLTALGTAYVIGWWHLRKGRARFCRPWRLVVYLAGLGFVGLALLSPIDTLASTLFLVHMVQHELLIMVAPPLLLLADPLPVLLWGLPRTLRLGMRRLLGRGARVRRILQVATWMPVAGGIFVGNLWAWHIPAAYEAALWSHLLHDLEHVTFFGTALLFWWPILNPAPRLHGQIACGLRILYILAATFQTVALGFVIAVMDRVLYPSYAATPRLWSLSPLDDQAFGGAIMSEGGMMFLIPLLVLISRWLNDEERRTRLREVISLRLRKAAE